MCNNQILFVIILVSNLPKFNASLWVLKENIDLNVDLANYKYFKNLPSQHTKTDGINKFNFLMEHFQKKKVILDYFQNLLFGNSPFTPESKIVFDPRFGQAWHPYYAKKYGWRGEYLIEALGNGYNLDQLRQYEGIPESNSYPS